jgi:adenylate kinase
MGEQFKAVLLFGPVCAGKGTLGRQLERDFQGLFHYIASGDLVRELKEGMPYHKEIMSYISRGKLIPDEIILPLFRHGLAGRIQKMDYLPSEKVLLVDGMYRTVEQAKDLETLLDLREVLHLSNLSSEEIKKRAKTRAEAEGRKDDNSAAIEKRITEYQTDTFPVLDHLRNKGVSVYDLDGSKSKEEVLSEARKRIMKEAMNYLGR